MSLLQRLFSDQNDESFKVDAPMDYELENSIEKSENLGRPKRRLGVFIDIYNRCRIQNRKEKEFCLYLANLYQSVKGIHGF
jgi:hypothetical protein